VEAQPEIMSDDVQRPDPDSLLERAHYLRIYMGALRHKLEKDLARPRFLLTEVGVGYCLAVD
jgi:DNA-binding response OmpR family regulator